nr:retrotransposon protein, putative, Ty1-copia subclass [Tanacetum cinerariifolium]
MSNFFEILMVDPRLRIAPVAIIDRQLHFEYAIASGSTDVMVSIPPALAADSATNVLAEWNAIYDAHNEELKSMFEKQARVESDFAGFVRNYNIHNTGKKISELHALLIEYKKGLPKKTATPQVMAIQSGRIRKANKKSQKAKGKGKGKGKGKDKSYIPKPKNPKPSAKEHPTKNDACHHYKEGFRGARKLEQGALYLYVSNGARAQVEAIESFDLVLPNDLVICLDNCHYAPTITRGVVSVSCLVDNDFIQRFIDYGILVSKNDVLYFNDIPSKMTRKSFPHRPERATDLLGLIHTDVYGQLRNVSRQESAARILNMVPTKKGCEALVKQDTPDKLQQRSIKCFFIRYPKKTMGYYFYFPSENKIVVARYVEFFEKNLLSQEVSERAGDLEEIQDKDTSPSENTSEIPMEVEEVEEHSLGDLNESANYKAAMLDPESNKWLDAMNAEMQSMKDNQVSCLVDLSPDCKTVGSKWLFKKKIDMNGNVHTHKALLIAMGFTQLYGVNYEKTFSPVTDIRAIRILLAIATSYDYEICQMDVKTTFLNGCLDEDIYMVQLEGFVNPKHPREVCKL